MAGYWLCREYKEVNVDLINTLMRMTCSHNITIGLDDTQNYNINADDAAAPCHAIGAENWYSNRYRRVYADPSDKSSLIVLTLEKADELLESSFVGWYVA